MSEDKAKELEKEISNINDKLDLILFHFKSDHNLGHVGIPEQLKINTEDISKLKIDKKILLGVGGVVGAFISGGFWFLMKVKSLL
jgi:hypothetical protein